jgi:hypothetical protein
VRLVGKGTINVEWVGGPNDGEWFTVSEHIRVIQIPVKHPPVFEHDDDLPTMIPIDVVALPIMRRERGFFVVYREST